MADFLLVTRRSLDDVEYRLFNCSGLSWMHGQSVVDGLAPDVGIRRLERGDFFQGVYRIQRKLGRVYHELQS